jgi:cell division protease FtsH
MASKDASDKPTQDERNDEGRGQRSKLSPPWRTEGLPPGEPGKPPSRWVRNAVWIGGALMLFAALQLQERLSGPDAVPYTEFKRQVTARNVADVFARGDSIQGGLAQPAPSPARPERSYRQFVTERPTFAKDDLLAELTGSGATVRATPLVEQRGFFTNLLMSIAPMLLLFGFWSWMLKRQQGAMGGLFGGGKQKLTEECYAEARRLLRDNRAKLDAIVVQLLAKESLDEVEIYAAASIAQPAIPIRSALAV